MVKWIYHKKVQLLLPIIIALGCLGLFFVLIMGFENHKKNGADLYIPLLPSDPRSLLQGDYMALRYELNISNPNPSNNDDWQGDWDYNNIHINNKSHITLYITTDNHRQLTASYFDKQPNTIPLIVKNKNNYLSNLYPASDSFLFGEGLAECYSKAQFAHLKVDNNGKTLLVGLLGEQLMPLHCEL